MYREYYGLKTRPFSITPDPGFVFLSPRHQDALAHLLYGVGRGGSGGFVQLTGEVGTGKTTLCRVLLEQVPETTRVALILNPMLEPGELLQAICRDLEIDTSDTNGSQQQLVDRLYHYLLETHAAGERVVLIIDEAQNMSREALEQVRLLTNLETHADKLLQIILLGQPELRATLARPELRQLSQRVTARYHLEPLNAAETAAYVRHRLAVAGSERCPFSAAALKRLYRTSGGVPRLINIIADRAMMAGYAREQSRIGPGLVNAAAREVVGGAYERSPGWLRGSLAAAAVMLVVAGGTGLAWLLADPASNETTAAPAPAWVEALEAASLDDALVEASGLWRGARPERLKEACEEGYSLGFACQAERGNWSLIRRLNQPVVLELVEPPGAHVLLVGMSDRELLLAHQGQRVRMPRSQAERRWLGEFLVIWPDDGEIYRAGDAGEHVARFKRLAAAHAPLPFQGTVDQIYDPAFREWVSRFQRYHGLREDGVVGPSTRLYLVVPELDGPGLILPDAEFSGDSN